VRYHAIGLVLAALACDGEAGSSVERPPEPAPPQTLVVLTDRDLDAYAAGTRTEIRYLRLSLRTARDVSGAELDSVGARAAAMPVERFREVARGVETALKQHTTLARGPQLDSLRIELLLLRVRTEGQHE